jgi:hypothetical protein
MIAATMKRNLARFAAAALAALLATQPAGASVSILLRYVELVDATHIAVVVLPLRTESRWENGRIYSSTVGRIESVIAGSAKVGDEVTIRALGGTVGELGQSVEGEPVFDHNRPALVFLRPTQDGRYTVVGRAQGQYVVEHKLGLPRVRASRQTGTLLRRVAPVGPLSPGVLAKVGAPAFEMMEGKSLDELKVTFGSEWKRAHAAK